MRIYSGLIRSGRRLVGHRAGSVWAIATLLTLALSIGWGWAQPQPLVARVDYAKSGQTLELLTELSPELPVMEIRLAGVQAPDPRQQPWGDAARQCLADLSGELIQIEPLDATTPAPDEYGRLWAYVWHDNQLVNAAVLEQGCGFLESDRPAQDRYRDRLIHAQEAARLQGLGVWSPDHPLRESPTAFRQRLESS